MLEIKEPQMIIVLSIVRVISIGYAVAEQNGNLIFSTLHIANISAAEVVGISGFDHYPIV